MRKPVKLLYGLNDTELLAPYMYVKYLNAIGHQVKEITEVSDNGYGYEWNIWAIDINDKAVCISFEPIEVLQWLVEYKL